MSYRASGKLESNAAWLLGFAAALGYWFFGKPQPSSQLRDTLSAVVAIAAIGVGFLITASSILVAVDHKWIVRRAKEAGAYGMLVRYLISATYWCLCAAILSAAGLLYDPAWKLAWYHYALAVWVLVVAGTLAAVIRAIRVFSEVLIALAEDED